MVPFLQITFIFSIFLLGRSGLFCQYERILLPFVLPEFSWRQTRVFFTSLCYQMEISSMFFSHWRSTTRNCFIQKPQLQLLILHKLRALSLISCFQFLLWTNALQAFLDLLNIWFSNSFWPMWIFLILQVKLCLQMDVCCILSSKGYFVISDFSFWLKFKSYLLYSIPYSEHTIIQLTVSLLIHI